jgi:4-hydroxythreonine-4-phosphate dehydrogenase
MRPRPLALTVGEPSGIGPEIAVKARLALGTEVPFFMIGDPGHLPTGAAATIISDPDQVPDVAAGSLPVLPHAFAAEAVPGQPSPDNARGVVEVIARAVALVRSGRASAVVTNPISKAALRHGAGFAFPGHTEYLAHLAGDVPVAMMLAAPELRVVPVTIHVPLAQVPSLLTAGAIEQAIRLTHAALVRDFGVDRPRIAVAGLNPHAGEGGTIGGEEQALIAPLVRRLAEAGMAVSGPWPADTLFHPAARARHDAVVAMYHDQALIPLKTLAFDRGVNVTLGLPFVRTSPDHGTAFDIAGKGVADPASLVAALRQAAEIAARRGPLPVQPVA